MNKNKLFKLCLVSLAFVVLITLYILGTNVAKNLEFNGVVQSVQYNINGSPTVTIDNSVYKLALNNWAFDGKIQVGDSLIKVKNTLVIKLVKKGTKEVILFY